jgi:hypothetical protein
VHLEHHHVTSGRLWAVDVAVGYGITIKIACDKDGGYTILACKDYSEGVTGGGACYVYDSTGLLLGTVWTGSSGYTYIGVCMAPDGKQAGGYVDTALYRVVVTPFSAPSTTLAAKGKGIDITDDDLYYVVGCENGSLYVFRVDGYAMGNTAYGGAATPIATVRNYT